MGKNTQNVLQKKDLNSFGEFKNINEKKNTINVLQKKDLNSFGQAKDINGKKHAKRLVDTRT